MLLEAGLKKRDDNDNKSARRWGSGIVGTPTTYVSFEEWVKRIGLAFFTIWMVFALFYVSTSSSTAAATGATDYNSATGRDDISTIGTFENAFPEETNFLVIGDFGTGSPDQVKTSEALKHVAATLDPKPAFVVSTGDQVYAHGCVVGCH